MLAVPGLSIYSVVGYQASDGSSVFDEYIMSNCEEYAKGTGKLMITNLIESGDLCPDESLLLICYELKTLEVFTHG